MARDYSYKHIEIFDLPHSAKLYFMFNKHFISVCRDREIYITSFYKLIDVDLSNLDSKLKEFLFKLECMYPEVEEFLNREIRIIHKVLIDTLSRSDFTYEMLNNVSFHVSPIKSAKKI
jgi:hypothetical protein